VPKLRAAAVLTTTALVLVPAVAQAAPSTPPRAGAAGIGDPYFPLDGHGGDDVQHYDLDVRYDPRTNVLQGVATIEARATHSLSSFNLDFVRPLTVRSVTVERRAASWRRTGSELKVVPRAALRNGSRFVVTVVYDGVPRTQQDALGFSGFFHTDDGALAVGQPDVAATWFPSNDHPSDAASVAVSITVPAGVEGVSNGLLVGQTTRRGWTTWEWRAAEPMATYLVVLAIGQFKLRQYTRPTGQQGGGPLRFVDALDPDLFKPDGEGPSRGEIAEKALARQPEIIGFLEGFFGAYPFRSAGGIVDDEARLQFALETQTRPIYSGAFFDDELAAQLVVVHEYAHMWFGDDLRLARWQDIWLNEGFATYAEWLWLEEQGLSTAKAQFDERFALPTNHPLWTVQIGNPGAATDKLFHPAVYERGAMTLHALRVRIGDQRFFELLRAWAATQSGDTVTTPEFVALAERIAGEQLDALFGQWLFTARKPAPSV
jgi:aminopeptidase N